MIEVARVLEFASEDRPRCVFSDSTKIRLDHELTKLTLKKTAGVYPTDSNLYVRCHAVSPDGLRRWTNIDASMSTPKSSVGAAVTSIQWRLSDGTDDRYWNGSTWAVAGASDWNTLAVVQANIATFPVTSKTLRPVVNLKTTDSRYSPSVFNIRLLFEANYTSVVEEVVLRGVKRRVEALRPTVEVAV